MPIVCTIKGCGSKLGKIKKCAKKHRTLQKLKSHFTGELSHKLRRHKVLYLSFTLLMKYQFHTLFDANTNTQKSK